MQKLTDHPSRKELSAYSLGQLPEERAVAIDCHISECKPCCETIVALSSADTFAALLQEAGRLPTDQTADHKSATANSASYDDIPPPLSEHPRYEVLGLIGKGGMGDVYKARHRKMERTVALKVINRGLVQKAEAIDRFHREVKAAAQLSHPNIVTSHDADHAGDFHFMVMEFVDGIDLSQTVKKRGALPVTEACDYVRQAALGLQHAHERGMVHRDIKPHNLMATAGGTIKILDFGLASLAPEAIPASEAVAARSDLTVAGAIMGTPDFISPEQAEDARQVDIRSDIYSLGATLYYLLSGQVPFNDGSVMQKLKSHAQVAPVPLSSLRDDVPEELVAIASKMMAKNPDERYLTPKEVAEALESFLRTWQLDASKSHGQVPSRGGNMFGSGGKESIVGEAGWDWPLAIARILIALACIPVALISYEAWSFNALFADLEGVENRVQAYLLATLLLSTIAGIAFALHRSNSDLRPSNSVVRRILGMKVSEAVAVAAVLVVGILGAVLLNAQVNSGTYVRGQGKVVAFLPQEGDEMSTVDPDTAVTIDPDTLAWGVELRVPSDDATLVQRGAQVKLVFEGWPVVDSAGLFEGEVIRIAPVADDPGMSRVLIREVGSMPWPDKRYLRPGVRVNCWISTASQSSGETRQFEGGTAGVLPATASTLSSNPALKITGKTVNKGTSGVPSVYDWNLKGSEVGELTVRLLLAENGKTEVVQEFDFEELPAEFANKIRLEVKDDARGTNRKRRVTAMLFVESPRPSRSSSLNEDKVLSIDVEEAFRDRIKPEDLTPIPPGQTRLLLALSYWKGDITHDRSMESMTAATNDGNATFLFVTLDWSPASSDDSSEKDQDQQTDADGKPILGTLSVSQLMRQANQPGPSSQLAINELLRREDEAILDIDQVNNLIDLVLKHQANRTLPWRTGMGDLIEKRWVAGSLHRDIWERYTAQFLVDTCELRVRPQIVIGSPNGVLVQRIIRDVRCGSGKYIEFLLREKNGVTRVGSTVVGRVDLAGTTQIGQDNTGMYAANSSPLTEQQWKAIEPGRQKITFDVDLAILESVGPEASEGLDVFASRKATFETETIFLPAGQSTVNVKIDPAVKEEVDRAITIKRVETGPISEATSGEKYSARVVFAVQPRPIDNIFTIILRDGETEYDAGSHAHVIKAEDGNNLIIEAPIAVDLSGKRIDVILRPAPDEAENSIDLFDIWGEEIVFEDVLVTETKP